MLTRPERELTWDDTPEECQRRYEDGRRVMQCACIACMIVLVAATIFGFARLD